jgi:predicted nuclease with TOPRIM domain
LTAEVHTLRERVKNLEKENDRLRKWNKDYTQTSTLRKSVLQLAVEK